MSLETAPLDGGRLRQCIMETCPGHTFNANARRIFRHFRHHDDADKWSQGLVEALERDLKLDRGQLAYLVGCSKDGAILFDEVQRIIGAAEQIRHYNQHYQLCGGGFMSGTRHSTAVGFVELLQRDQMHGGALVGSDSGWITLVLPGPTGLQAWRCQQ